MKMSGRFLTSLVFFVFVLDTWKWEITGLAQNADVVFKPVYAAVLAGLHAFAVPNIFVGRNDTDVLELVISVYLFFLLSLGLLFFRYHF